METLTDPDAPVIPVAHDGAVLDGYDQDTVDDFLRAVDEEKGRLRVEIDAARARQQRALMLVRMHETMLVTMRDAYEDVTATRRAAEVRAAAILEAAARRAAATETGAEAFRP